MIKLRLSEMLEERGQTLYWLWKETGIRYATLWQIGQDDVVRLNLEVLDIVCDALKCQPGDLIVKVAAKRKRAKKKGD